MVSIINIKNKLRSKFDPLHLEVIDESILHKGHQNFKQGFVTHIRITITSEDFTNKTKIAVHQSIYQALEEEIRAGLHAIAIEAKG